MQVSFAGHPYLFVNSKYRGKYIPPSEAKGQWINYGGDKLWPLPEGQGPGEWPGPISDPLDDGVYELKIISQSPRCTLRLEGPSDPATGLKFTREISLQADSPQIFFHSVMTNTLQHSMQWSMQSVTQYDTSDPKHPGEFNHNFWAATEINPRTAYFGGYHVRSGLADDPSFTTSGNLFKLHWTYLENEVWLDSTAGWLAIVDGESQFAMVERFRYVSGAEYPGFASIIFYKNGAALGLDENGHPILRSADRENTPYYMEAEINSPLVKLEPGQSYTMDTSWLPTRANVLPRRVINAGLILSPIEAVWSGNFLTLTGSFGVFFPGKLRATLFDSRGVEQESHDLQSVSPQKQVELQQTITPKTRPARVSVELVDPQGNARVELGQIAITNAEP